MTDFTASNGIGVRLDEGVLDFKNGPTWFGLCGGAVVEALREFFRAEEDERLSRWRSTIDPDIVGYAVDDASIRLVDEATHGNMATFYRTDRDGLGPLSKAAREYFDAHPEPKPAWHEAKPGEVWALGIGGGYHGESIAVVETPDGLRFVWGVKGGDVRSIPVDDRGIDYGTRIYPEVSS